MPTVIRFEDFGDYTTFNEDFANSNTLMNFFLISCINQVFEGKLKLHNFFNIKGDNNEHLTVLHSTDACLIYADGYTVEMISLLHKELNFAKFNKYHFAGSKNVIKELFAFGNRTYKTVKDRNFYTCRQLDNNFICSAGKMTIGDLSKLDELTDLSVQFTESYEKKKGISSEQQAIVRAGIINNIFFQWTQNNCICSVIQAIENQHDFPVIGHFFTNPGLRGKGYGGSLVYSLTNLLLCHDNEFCRLVTEADNPYSNRAFIKVGYTKDGDYLSAFMSG